MLDLVAAAARVNRFVLVGIGGRGGAGKSTLAASIPRATVVPTDAFWDGEGFDLSRVKREVLRPLLRGETARYAAYDWLAQAPAGTRSVEPAGVVVIEGVCALHRMFRDAYHVRVWVEAPYEVRLARGVARDGEAARATWVETWMPREDSYVEHDDPIPSAHLVVDGS